MIVYYWVGVVGAVIAMDTIVMKFRPPETNESNSSTSLANKTKAIKFPYVVTKDSSLIALTVTRTQSSKIVATSSYYSEIYVSMLPGVNPCSF